MNAIFWPKHLKEDSQIVVRLGRVLHWALAALSLALLTAVPALIVTNHLEVVSTRQEHKKWLAENPPAVELPNGRMKFTFLLADGHHVEIDGDPDKTRTEAITVLESRGYRLDDTTEPYVQPYDFINPIVFAIIAVFLFAVGRGLRYIVADE